MYTLRGLFTNAQVINNIMTGPYKSLYNPENVYRNEAGGGAGNNWAQGYAAGEKAADELIEMVDREADGSESLEVRALYTLTPGVFPVAFYSRRNRLRTGIISAGASKRCISQKADSNIQRFSKLGRDIRCGGSTIQFCAHT